MAHLKHKLRLGNNSGDFMHILVGMASVGFPHLKQEY